MLIVQETPTKYCL